MNYLSFYLPIVASGVSIVNFLRDLGPFGFLVLEALNSSFLYMPVANEVLMLAFVQAGRKGLIWLFIVLCASAGSVVGVFLADLAVRRLGEEGLYRLVKPKHIKRIKGRMERGAGGLIFFTSMMPPPFPFRPVMLTASALQTPRRVMFPAIFLGRLIRFGAEAALLFYFGGRLVEYMTSDLFNYIIYGIVIIGLLGGALTAWKWFHSTRTAEARC